MKPFPMIGKHNYETNLMAGNEAVLNQSIKVFPMNGKLNMKLNDETIPSDWIKKL
jgi:hypothetical protein